MIRTRVLLSVVTLMLLVGLSPVMAQDDLLEACGATEIQYSPAPPPFGQDNINEQFRFLCGQVVSALTTVQPTVGIAFTGGAHTLGTATTIGRRLGLVPRISVTARANAALADIPTLLGDYEAQIDPDGELPAMGTTRVPVGSLQGDVTVGLFNGFSVGPAAGGFGAVDLLGSVSWVPAFEEAGLEEDIINWGVGARLGLLRQGLVTPGLSVSGMYRNMGEVSFGDIDDGDPAHFATDMSTISLRAAVSKGLLTFDFTAGGGYDIYTSDVLMDFELICPAGTPPSGCGTPTTLRPLNPETGETGITGELQTAAWNVYGNVGLNLLLLNVVGEIGYQKATDLVTLDDLRDSGLADEDSLADDLDDGRFFGSIGLRLTL